MKKNIKDIIIIELLILIFIIMFKINLFNLSNINKEYFLYGFFILLSIICLILFKRSKDKNYFKDSVVRITVALLMAAILIAFICGIFMGFKRNVFLLTPLGIFKNIAPIIIFIICIEFIRYSICRNSFYNIKPVIGYTILMIILDVIIEINLFDFYDSEQIFKFVSMIVLPSIAKEMVLSYVSYKVGLLPTLIYRIPLEIYSYIFPILPDLGDYFYSVLFICLPFIYYINVHHIITFNEKIDYNSKRLGRYILTIPLVVLTLFVLILATGITRYKMIAIASNSMNPFYGRGDAVIFKYKDVNEIDVGEILIFNNDGMTVTHRVIKKWIKDDKVCFKTKGDNNTDADPYEVVEDDVYGTAVMIIPYIGYPSLWISRK